MMTGKDSSGHRIAYVRETGRGFNSKAGGKIDSGAD